MAEIVDVNQKTAWFFMRKIQKTMGALISNYIADHIPNENYQVDSIILTHRGEKLNGLQQIKIAWKQSKKQAGKIKQFHFASVLLDPTTMNPCQLVAGKYVDKPKSLILWNYKTWLTGMHHHCSAKYLQAYMDEFNFKLAFRNNKHLVWHTLINGMTLSKPWKFKRNAAKMDNRALD
jgi:hypothetical protein